MQWATSQYVRNPSTRSSGAFSLLTRIRMFSVLIHWEGAWEGASVENPHNRTEPRNYTEKTKTLINSATRTEGRVAVPHSPPPAGAAASIHVSGQLDLPAHALSLETPGPKKDSWLYFDSTTEALQPTQSTASFFQLTSPIPRTSCHHATQDEKGVIYG